MLAWDPNTFDEDECELSAPSEAHNNATYWVSCDGNFWLGMFEGNQVKVGPLQQVLAECQRWDDEAKAKLMNDPRR